jgi:hypothetical protein
MRIADGRELLTFFSAAMLEDSELLNGNGDGRPQVGRPSEPARITIKAIATSQERKEIEARFLIKFNEKYRAATDMHIKNRDRELVTMNATRTRVQGQSSRPARPCDEGIV